MNVDSIIENENNKDSAVKQPSDFIRTRIQTDLLNGKNNGRLHTRFPPEPNGYLHLGHAKSICLNFGVANEFNGLCNLRLDDTNPTKEEVEYVDSIRNDVKWLGFSWDDREFFASDYFEFFYEQAVRLIKMDKAYVDSLSADEIRAYRGTLKEPGKNSPYRNRSIEENLDLFKRMRNGEFEDGTHVLRAKIDMSSPNVVMRDPTLYRIRKVAHHRTGDKWCIYPMYDFAHCLSDSHEGVTHSLCTLEFENNRELYDWVLENLELFRSQQIEFARLNITRTVLSKRKLIQLVQEKHVNGWDDPRMPTLSGLRRRGCTPEALRNFCSRIGVSRADNMVEYSMLEFCMREHLNAIAPRLMAVLDPIKVVIENYPEGQVEWFDMPLDPEDESKGKRKVPFGRTLFIERDDFKEEAPKKYHRLSVGKEVRLRYAYYIVCQSVVKNEQGDIVELRCTYDPATKGGWSEDGRKVKGTLHWVEAENAVKAEVRLYDYLFKVDNPSAEDDFLTCINQDSLKKIEAYIEPALNQREIGDIVQFERLGYFRKDEDSTQNKSVFNRTVGLKESW
ncbi:glutamine--tRNA ligase/YqeY domain fusion protein [Desulfovibrio litoralis]|uniref:Glutamine--tRNA ligase n=1 Tax=Desulfovibrio litoralis DSM 11393 TaxID=1121455 RepID=A0A1M7SNF1_9BACT|nr:glutamine--tRNA ligase/YqeY domain fusion protein [Desulfovibrio litoralis]SHN59993.1 glutaminyl-tRNA synthetase [Desulfovibrio litoralis DSM 11393]